MSAYPINGAEEAGLESIVPRSRGVSWRDELAYMELFKSASRFFLGVFLGVSAFVILFRLLFGYYLEVSYQLEYLYYLMMLGLTVVLAPRFKSAIEATVPRQSAFRSVIVFTSLVRRFLRGVLSLSFMAFASFLPLMFLLPPTVVVHDARILRDDLPLPWAIRFLGTNFSFFCYAFLLLSASVLLLSIVRWVFLYRIIIVFYLFSFSSYGGYIWAFLRFVGVNFPESTRQFIEFYGPYRILWDFILDLNNPPPFFTELSASPWLLGFSLVVARFLMFFAVSLIFAVISLVMMSLWKLALFGVEARFYDRLTRSPGFYLALGVVMLGIASIFAFQYSSILTIERGEASQGADLSPLAWYAGVVFLVVLLASIVNWNLLARAKVRELKFTSRYHLYRTASIQLAVFNLALIISALYPLYLLSNILGSGVSGFFASIFFLVSLSLLISAFFPALSLILERNFPQSALLPISGAVYAFLALIGLFFVFIHRPVEALLPYAPRPGDVYGLIRFYWESRLLDSLLYHRVFGNIVNLFAFSLGDRGLTASLVGFALAVVILEIMPFVFFARFFKRFP